MVLLVMRVASSAISLHRIMHLLVRMSLHLHLMIGRLWIMTSSGWYVVEMRIILKLRRVLSIFPFLVINVLIALLSVIVDGLIELWALIEEVLQIEVFIPAVTH